MPFTSSSANKNNIFRVTVPKEELFLPVEECATYTIVQKAPLLIPVLCQSPKGLYQQPAQAKHVQIECLDVKQVLANCSKCSKNTLKLLLPGKLKTINSCKITTTSLKKKHIPLPEKQSTIAILTFSYRIELTYTDFLGNTHTITKDSGPRRQRVLLDTPSGALDVRLQLTCLLPEISCKHLQAVVAK
ncbi:MAG: hypothetical protein GX167_06460 [Firmicutes bacterium]|jgi:hypothetical protein|nr:hypothetical protein [Bacillota bacterium]